jgi:anaerobic dimethyl sulfoxide reductase subunit B (iron-sulfur subunit)
MTKKQYGFYIHTDRCVQCHACELACKTWNGLESGVRWRKVMDVWNGHFPHTTNRTFSISCMHCEKPSCMDACPENAIRKRVEDGIVVVDPHKCVGCRTCGSACPFHIPQYGKTGVMEKCTLCLERLLMGMEPACVAACPGEALQFGTMESMIEKSRSFAGKRLSAAILPCLVISGELAEAAILDKLTGSRPA